MRVWLPASVSPEKKEEDEKTKEDKRTEKKRREKGQKKKRTRGGSAAFIVGVSHKVRPKNTGAWKGRLKRFFVDSYAVELAKIGTNII